MSRPLLIITKVFCFRGQGPGAGAPSGGPGVPQGAPLPRFPAPPPPGHPGGMMPPGSMDMLSGGNPPGGVPVLMTSYGPGEGPQGRMDHSSHLCTSWLVAILIKNSLINNKGLKVETVVSVC